MTPTLYVATAMGLFIAAQSDGNWQVVNHVISGQHVTSVTAADGIILAGTKDGIRRSADNGESWHEAGTDLGSGVYFLRVHAGLYRTTRKIVLLR